MKAKITTLTPVHIGNGTTYNKNIDFIQSGKEIGIIDEKKVFNLIGEDNLHQWVAAIDKGGNAFIELLKKRGWKEDDLGSICSRIDRLKTTGHYSTQLKEIYRTSLKGITLPGSSIKGVIKTAVLNLMLTEDELKKIRFNDLQNRKGKFDFTNLDQKYFGEDANEKSTRFLKVRDAHFENIAADVYEVQILNKTKEGWSFKQGQQTLVEAIPANSSAEFDLIVDDLLLKRNKDNEPNEKRRFENDMRNAYKKFKPKWDEKKTGYLDNGIAELCRLVTEHTKYLVGTDFNNLNDETLNDAEEILDAYDKIYVICENSGENEMILRVGGHSGYLFTTGQWVGMDKQINITDDEFNSLRKNIQKRDYSNMPHWPKTRKVTSGGQLFGFVKIAFL